MTKRISRGSGTSEQQSTFIRRAEDNPLERLERSGLISLSEMELLSILIGNGSGPDEAIALAAKLFEKCGTIHQMAKMTLSELCSIDGIGTAKASAILAAFEIGRRLQSSEGGDQPRISGPADAAAVVIPRLADLRHEVFEIILLSSANRVQKIARISSGTLSMSLVHPREVFKVAIDELAASIILTHNHPSGNNEPSHEDLSITRQLVEAGKILGIPVHDHIIIAGYSYTSMVEKQVFPI